MVNKKKTILAQRREETILDLVNKLNKYGKCALIRCMGFGKTWLLAHMTKKYKKVLYLYPAEVVRTTVEHVVSLDYLEEKNENFVKAMLRSEDNSVSFKNIKFMTYMKLIRLKESELKECSQYDLIIFDECHKIGAELTGFAVEKLFKYCRNSKFIGSTATPNRKDAVDVVGKFFSNIVVEAYTLHDAIQDGIIKKPYYCYCTYDIETDLKQEALTAGQDINDIKVKEVLNAAFIELSKIYNMERIIRNVIKTYVKDYSYLKFIVFFSGFSQLDEKGKEVLNWFEKAFPKYNVNTLVISSRNNIETENVYKLDTLTYRPRCIDLIYCVDMLNMGYHVNYLTGVVMYRGTSSSIVYNQQLGRALSTGSDNASIVFDVVDNLHRKYVYELYEKKAYTLKKRTVDNKETDDFDKLYNNLTDNCTIDSIDSIDSIDNFTEDKFHWWTRCNIIEPEDLYAVEHEATYRELITKVIAEPIAVRAKIAAEKHFELWCESQNIPYPNSREAFEKIGSYVPLEPIARWQNVTLKQVLDTKFPELQ